MAEDGILNMWTVYDHPKDAPDHFVSRLFEIGPNKVTMTDQVIVEVDLDALRHRLQFEKGCSAALARNEGDDPAILETWI